MQSTVRARSCEVAAGHTHSRGQGAATIHYHYPYTAYHPLFKLAADMQICRQLTSPLIAIVEGINVDCSDSPLKPKLIAKIHILTGIPATFSINTAE
jgi:hypothetical protein